MRRLGKTGSQAIYKAGLLALLCICIVAGGCAANKPPAVVVRVVDGDTIVVCLQSGKQETVRLIGVDTPETVHPLKNVEAWGPQASAFTKQILPVGMSISLEFDVEQRDRYGRLLAYVYLPDGRMVNSLLLQEGLAQLLTIPPNVKHVDLFISLQQQARLVGKGMWQGLQQVGEGNVTVNLTINRQDETAIIVNSGKTSIDIKGWTLVSTKGGQKFTLPELVLQPNTQVKICSGPNAGKTGCLTWTKSNVWNDKDDPGEIYDAYGRLLASG